MTKSISLIKSKKFIFAAAILVLILIIGGYMLFNNIQERINENTIKTDLKPIINRLPLLTNIEQCYWKVKVLSKESLLAPGPTRYVMYAYVKLKEEDFKAIYDKYVWENVDNRFSLAFILENYEKSNNWKYCEQFNKYITPSQFYGKFYIEPKQKLIYFEIQQ